MSPVVSAELGAWLRLLLTPGVGNEKARRLLAAFGSPEAVFEQPASALQTVAGERLGLALQHIPEAWAPAQERLAAWLAASPDHHVVVLGDALYPPTLLEMADPPLMLYVLGDLGALSHPQKLAVVGSRNPTPQGEANARQFATAMGEAACASSPAWRWASMAPPMKAPWPPERPPWPSSAPGSTVFTPNAIWISPTASLHRGAHSSASIPWAHRPCRRTSRNATASSPGWHRARWWWKPPSSRAR